MAIAFRSYIQPTIVMFAIPFGVVGAVAGSVKYTLDLRQERRLVEAAREDAESLIVFMFDDLHRNLKALGRLDLLEAVAAEAAAHYERFPEASLDTVQDWLGVPGRAERLVVVLDETVYGSLSTQNSVFRVRRIAEQMVDVLGGEADTYEISIRKGHQYLTVVLDYTSGRVVFVGQDRKADTLERFFNQLNDAQLAGIEAVVMDMWDPFIKAVKKKFLKLKSYSICFMWSPILAASSTRSETANTTKPARRIKPFTKAPSTCC